MKKTSKQILFILMTVVIFSLAAVSCSAADVKATSVDTIGAVMAENAYEVIVTGDGINLPKRKTLALSAEVTGVKKQPEITWTSSDPKVATVNEEGVVKGVSVGRVLITATAEVAGQTVEGYYSVNVITSKNFVKTFMEGNQIVSYRYSYVDDYFYTDDKNCWQDTFGYARIYDLMSPYIAFEYDYIRVFFTYEEKDFMVQLWKGQYGYVMYGSEIGIYSKKASDKEVGMLTFFKTAEKEYWPKMEMTLYHENILGEWEREFTRDYDEYWWCTGFKPGHLRQLEPADELRMVSKITFEDAKMARLFTLGLKECGFTRAKNVNSLENDNYYRVGADVHFRWQNISEAENTMPLKITAVALIGFNFIALLMVVLLMLGLGSIALLFLI